jgi:hopanoid biosynthesis associated protein HpnK
VNNKKILIVNADDFGRHELINKAVEEGMLHGLIRSATVMVTGKAFDGAVALAKKYPQLGMGIHFTLVDGLPVLPPEQIPSLVDPATGRFYPDHGAFVKHFLKGRVKLSEVRAECQAQLDKFLATGLVPTHADSHQHMHVLPGIIDVIVDLCVKAGIPAMRIPAIPVSLTDTRLSNLGEQIGRTGLHVLSEQARRKARRHGLLTPDYFGGIVAGNAVDTACIRTILLQMRPGATEIMVHPGTDDAILQADSHWDHSYTTELRAVTDPGNVKLTKQLGITAENFRGLHQL